MKFLEHIVEDINPEQLNELENKTYVFPTRRAGAHFQELMKSRFNNHTFWAPQVFSIDDFIIHLSGKHPTEELTLIFDLFKSYRKYDPQIKFDKFFSWAEVLIRDFDEIDKYLVDASKLYRNLFEIEELDQQFADQEETQLLISQFNKVIHSSKNGAMSQSFVKTWDIIGKVYLDFQNQLSRDGKAYPGMLYREVAEKIDELEIEFEHIIFCGFNALTKSEESLISHFMERNICTIYWDADKSYLEDDLDEAGKFLRRYRRLWPGSNSKWVISDYMNSNSKLEIIGTAQLVAQAKITGNALTEMLKDGIEHGSTAIVLADENLLFPILYALPDQIKEANVTMGYSLKKSGIHNIVESYLRTISNQKGKRANIFFRRSDVLRFINQPLIKLLYPGIAEDATVISQGRSKWVNSKILKDQNIAALLQLNDPAQTLKLLIDLLKDLNLRLRNRNSLEQEFNYHYLKLLINLDDKINESSLHIDYAIIYKIVMETARSAKVPFSGEPSTGLQIMGFLETRTIDFDQVFLLSVNENKLPAKKQQITYIPYALRKAYKMPTFEVQDAIYAYHFKRLLQRSKHCRIIYDTEVAIDGSGEKSRFILQMEQLLQESSIDVSQAIYGHPLEAKVEAPLISVEKNPQVIEDMDKYFRVDEPLRLSPTKLATYIECKLRFYFKHVASIRETEEFSEDMDAREFGIIVHKVLEQIYRKFEGQEMIEKDFDQLLTGNNIAEEIDEALRDYRFTDNLEGKNLLNKSIIIRLIESVIQHDKIQTPLKMIALEETKLSQSIEVDGKEINLGGTIDRIDQLKDGSYRIIDYKTGVMKLVAPTRNLENNLESYISEYFENPKLKSGFQAYYYTYLFKKKFPERTVKTGIYGLKEINKGIHFLRQGENIDDRIMEEFETQLKKIIREIFNPEIPFDETEDRSRCEYCTYKNLCRRR